MSAQYSTISRFGNTTNQKNTTVSPLTYLTSDLNTAFNHGFDFGPSSQPVQLYMSQRCANNWDGVCETFYRTNTERNFVNMTNTGIAHAPAETAMNATPITIGEQMLQATARQRFCRYEGCLEIKSPFDPTVADSPMISTYTSYNNGGPCIPVCDKINPRTIDADPVMNLALANPGVCSNTLINICNTAKRNGTNLSGTKIGGFCKLIGY